MKLKLSLSISLLVALSACTQEPAPVNDYTKEKYDLSVAAKQMRDGAQPVSATSNGTYSPGSYSGSSDVVKTAVPQVEENNDFLPTPIPAVQEEGDFLPQEKVSSDVNENDQGSMRLIEVLPGQTLNTIAEDNKLPIRAIIDSNNLTPPYELTTGQKLFLPKGEFHEVKAGETMFSISRQYGVDVTSLARLNAMEGREARVGEKLQIPHRNMEDNVFESNESKITGNLDVSEEDVQPVVHMGTEELGPPEPKEEDKKAKVIKVADEEVAPIKEKAAKEVPVKEENVKVTFKDDGKFAWPVKGTVVKKFSDKNDGINIATADGTKVRASRPGEVVYAGNELKGYGNLVLVKHTDGYLTAYAHMKDIKVKKGDKLGKGTIVGEVGKTGKVKSPQLFFAIRKGKAASDPQKFLK